MCEREGERERERDQLGVEGDEGVVASRVGVVARRPHLLRRLEHRLPNHTVEYGPFVKSQLASRNQL